MKKNTYNERELRLECVKIAAALTMQLKMKQESVVGVATQLYAFVTADDQADDGRRF